MSLEKNLRSHTRLSRLLKLTFNLTTPKTKLIALVTISAAIFYCREGHHFFCAVIVRKTSKFIPNFVFVQAHNRFYKLTK